MAIVKEMEFSDFTLDVASLALHENLPDERGNSLDGIWHCKTSLQRQAGSIRQAGMNTLTDSPNLSFAWQSCQRLDSIIDYNIVKLANQSLV